MDNLDIKILSVYQLDTKISAEQIGSNIGLSASAVQRRIKQLRKEGVIKQEVALLDLDKIGFSLHFAVSVNLVNDGRQYIQAFETSMLKSPLVQQCFYITGENDFIITVVARTVSEYEQFTQDVLMANENVRSFTSSLILKNIKCGTGAPLDAV